MNENPYATPGWMAIAAAALTFPMIALGLILDIASRKNTGLAATFLLPYILVAVAQTVCGLYALGRFKTLLNQRHGFHDVDGLIVAIIVGVCLLTLIAITGRLAFILLGVSKGMAATFVGVLITLGIPLAILGIAFAIKLLRLNSDLGGLLKPLVYVNIAASICFATFILAPLGLLLDAAGNAILGTIFLRREAGPTIPDFV